MIRCWYLFTNYKLTSGVDSVDSNRSFSVASNRLMLCCIASLSFLVGVWTRNLRSSLGGVAGLLAAANTFPLPSGELECDRGGETCVGITGLTPKNEATTFIDGLGLFERFSPKPELPMLPCSADACSGVTDLPACLRGWSAGGAFSSQAILGRAEEFSSLGATPATDEPPRDDECVALSVDVVSEDAVSSGMVVGMDAAVAGRYRRGCETIRGIWSFEAEFTSLLRKISLLDDANDCSTMDRFRSAPCWEAGLPPDPIDRGSADVIGAGGMAAAEVVQPELSCGSSHVLPINVLLELEDCGAAYSRATWTNLLCESRDCSTAPSRRRMLWGAFSALAPRTGGRCSPNCCEE